MLSVTKSQQPSVLSSSSIIGTKVRNNQQEELGEIKEVMLDLEYGRIAYAVLSFGGFLGIADKLFAIPFGSLTFNPNTEEAHLDVDKEKLEAAPGFDKDNWPQTSDRKWGLEIYRYYRVEPYWT